MYICGNILKHMIKFSLKSTYFCRLCNNSKIHQLISVLRDNLAAVFSFRSRLVFGISTKEIEKGQGKHCDRIVKDLKTDRECIFHTIEFQHL